MKIVLPSSTAEDSTIVPSDGGVGGSRATRVYGNASYEAGVKARDELLAFAAQALEVEPKELELPLAHVTVPPPPSVASTEASSALVG